jgi:hypothetical protein
MEHGVWKTEDRGLKTEDRAAPAGWRWSLCISPGPAQRCPGPHLTRPSPLPKGAARVAQRCHLAQWADPLSPRRGEGRVRGENVKRRQSRRTPRAGAQSSAPLGAGNGQRPGAAVGFGGPPKPTGQRPVLPMAIGAPGQVGRARWLAGPEVEVGSPNRCRDLRPEPVLPVQPRASKGLALVELKGVEGATVVV